MLYKTDQSSLGRYHISSNPVCGARNSQNGPLRLHPYVTDCYQNVHLGIIAMLRTIKLYTHTYTHAGTLIVGVVCFLNQRSTS
jgi:hypothetical protein